jgi:superfamily II DNA/RNA helicase
MSIYGGETIKESAKRLETAPIDIICATPGRLIAMSMGAVSRRLALSLMVSPP